MLEENSDAATIPAESANSEEKAIPKRYYINRQSSSLSFPDSHWQVFKIFSLKIDSNLVRFRLCNTRLANMFLFNSLVVFSRVIIKNRALY